MGSQRCRVLVRARIETAHTTPRARVSSAARTIGNATPLPYPERAGIRLGGFTVNAAPQFEVAPDDAARLLELVAPGERVTFQTFDDAKRDQRGLTRILHGTLAEHATTLAALNARGAGVYWMVNAGDGNGRKASNVQRVRALFVDLDGAPLEPVTTAPLPPHAIIESSANRWHAYWRVTDCRLSDFKPLQQALAARFDADPKVCDLPRVLRLPGFDHRKGKPYRSHIIELHRRQPYTVADLVQAFDLRAPEAPAPVANVTLIHKRARTLPDVIPEGKRNATLLSLAGGLVRQGFDVQAVNDRLQRINAERCTPPLGADEVDTIAMRAIGYGSQGFAMLPHKLLDSPEWKALPPAAHDVIVTAFRRYNGANGDNIALTWADFEGREGFAQKGTFYRHRARAIASGILQRSREGRNGQTGRKPDLFSIAPQWLQHSASIKNRTRPQYRKSTPLHR
jgi:hypothetical protein